MSASSFRQVGPLCAIYGGLTYHNSSTISSCDFTPTKVAAEIPPWRDAADLALTLYLSLQESQARPNEPLTPTQAITLAGTARPGGPGATRGQWPFGRSGTTDG